MKIMFIDGSGNGLLKEATLPSGTTLGELITLEKGRSSVGDGHMIRIRRGMDTLGGQGVDALSESEVLQDGDKVAVTVLKHQGGVIA